MAAFLAHLAREMVGARESRQPTAEFGDTDVGPERDVIVVDLLAQLLHRQHPRGRVVDPAAAMERQHIGELRPPNRQQIDGALDGHAGTSGHSATPPARSIVARHEGPAHRQRLPRSS